MADKDKPAGVNGAAGEDHATSPQDSTESNIYGAHMLPQHAALLAASAISPEVAAARGYRSVETKADLERKGFSRAQRNVPGLLIPIYDSTGEFATYQYRPDEHAYISSLRESYVDGDPKTVKQKIEAVAESYKTDDIGIVTICFSFADRVRSYELVAEAFGLQDKDDG
ncbi:MAG: hypothetical protein IIC83_10170 [Chloroflexi bacterium]|nr:hypothetical protein [Chloroflexota bacterium]